MRSLFLGNGGKTSLPDCLQEVKRQRVTVLLKLSLQLMPQPVYFRDQQAQLLVGWIYAEALVRFLFALGCRIEITGARNHSVPNRLDFIRDVFQLKEKVQNWLHLRVTSELKLEIDKHFSLSFFHSIVFNQYGL